MLALALAVGIAVAVLSAGERTRAVQGSSLPAIEQRTDQRLAKPQMRSASGPSCAVPGGCTRL